MGGGAEVEEDEDVEEMEKDRELGVTSQVYVEENESSTSGQVVVKSSVVVEEESSTTDAVVAAEDSSTGSLDDGNSGGGGGSVVSSRIFGQGNRRYDDDDEYYDEDDDASFCSDIKNKQRCNNRDNCRVSKGSSFPFCCCFAFVPIHVCMICTKTTYLTHSFH